jgi:hypothetical protein
LSKKVNSLRLMLARIMLEIRAGQSTPPVMWIGAAGGNGRPWWAARRQCRAAGPAARRREHCSKAEQLGQYFIEEPSCH